MASRILRLLLVATVTASCVPGGSPPPAEQTAAVALVWPSPPARARIRFVRTVARPADLAVQPSFLERLGQIIVGRQEEWLIRPTAVVAKGPVLYVADAGAQALWIIDTQRGRFDKVQTAGEQPLISPVALAVGADGRVYVADSFLAKVFVYGADLHLKDTIAAVGLRRPAGLAFDAVTGRLYVADSAAHRVWIYGTDGRPAGEIGSRGTGDGEFNFPTHVAVDRNGTVYVVDSLGFRVQVFDRDGRFVRRFGHHGDSAGHFARPKGVALDSDKHVYVVEALFDAVQIFDHEGRFLLSFGERGVAPGQFWLPAGVFIDPDNRVYVADAYNQRIQIFQYLAGGDDQR